MSENLKQKIVYAYVEHGDFEPHGLLVRASLGGVTTMTVAAYLDELTDGDIYVRDGKPMGNAQYWYKGIGDLDLIPVTFEAENALHEGGDTGAKITMKTADGMVVQHWYAWGMAVMTRGPLGQAIPDPRPIVVVKESE
ncbi:hypothetical protein [Nonomuraea sp. SYSU D8015]|uniref:hypothetical protein n=1 Tax=Nonomuraea sp. SYSU D8015 TaxID=2593644 RepID=UPI001661807C|nr:hypothetical protein [Nonomuraea sp. SYSU D8015]